MSSPSPLITLTTDFGTSDPYVGLVKGVVLGINPNVTLVDITHEIAPQNVLQGAFLLGNSYGFFPAHSIHLAVVDPGVGTSRRPVLLDTPQGRFIGPDNGILSYVLLANGQPAPAKVGQVALPPQCRAYHLTNPCYWLRSLSSTFHGRDLFGPVAAHLSLGVSPRELGEEISSLICLPVATPAWDDNRVLGQVVHIDRFGNLVTDLRASLFQDNERVMVQVGGKEIQGLSASYVEGGEILALIGSCNTLEVAVKNGSAAARLGSSIGDAVTVVRKL